MFCIADMRQAQVRGSNWLSCVLFYGPYDGAPLYLNCALKAMFRIADVRQSQVCAFSERDHPVSMHSMPYIFLPLRAGCSIFMRTSLPAWRLRD
jgi:hypothetical protein